MSIKTPAVLAIAALLLASPSFIFAQSAAVQSGKAHPPHLRRPTPLPKRRRWYPRPPFSSRPSISKATSGTQVKVQLKGKVRLGNGAELPSGTVLVGQVVDDTTHPGKARLALRFTEANLERSDCARQSYNLQRS